jgi:hypothetical protein
MLLSALPMATLPFKSVLRDLAHLLKHLPNELPSLSLGESCYKDIAEGYIDEEFARKSLEAATNKVLEVFPYSEHLPNDQGLCIPHICECGVPVQALVKYLKEHCPKGKGLSLMSIWATDLCMGVCQIYKKHRKVSEAEFFNMSHHTTAFQIPFSDSFIISGHPSDLHLSISGHDRD